MTVVRLWGDQIDLYVCRPVEAVQLTADNIRHVAEWLGPDDTGYSWYDGQPARFRGPAGEVVAGIGCWLVRLGKRIAVLDDADFSDAFFPADDVR